MGSQTDAVPPAYWPTMAIAWSFSMSVLIASDALAGSALSSAVFTTTL